jgi:MerR family mercuric resistance operon transcriptional regulator
MDKNKETKLLRVGQLAKETNEQVTTIRYWATEGLLRVKELTESGYQLFEPEMIDRVKTIRRLQTEKRLTIAEIKKELE